MDLMNKLKMPFKVNQIHWRPGAMTKNKTPVKAIALAYVDARNVMHRLDEVCGIDGWQNRYSHVGQKGVVCEIGIKINDEWLWKSNGAGESDIEAEKGALSDAFKRAAVMWGIGRYLYLLPNTWVELDQYKKIIKPPPLPTWATPEGFEEALKKRGENNAH